VYSGTNEAFFCTGSYLATKNPGDQDMALRIIKTYGKKRLHEQLNALAVPERQYRSSTARRGEQPTPSSAGVCEAARPVSA